MAAERTFDPVTLPQAALERERLAAGQPHDDA